MIGCVFSYIFLLGEFRWGMLFAWQLPDHNQIYMHSEDWSTLYFIALPGLVRLSYGLMLTVLILILMDEPASLLLSHIKILASLSVWDWEDYNRRHEGTSYCDPPKTLCAAIMKIIHHISQMRLLCILILSDSVSWWLLLLLTFDSWCYFKGLIFFYIQPNH